MARLNRGAIDERAREMLDAKLATISALVAARESVARAKQSVTDAEKEEARAYAETLSAGWSVTELNQLGLHASKAQRRPRRVADTIRSDDQALS